MASAYYRHVYLNSLSSSIVSNFISYRIKVPEHFDTTWLHYSAMAFNISRFENRSTAYNTVQFEELGRTGIKPYCGIRVT